MRWWSASERSPVRRRPWQLLFGYNLLSAESTNGMEDDSGAVSIAPTGANNNEITFTINKYQINTFKVALGDVPTTTAVARVGSIPSFGDLAFTVTAAANGYRSAAKFLIPRDERVSRVSLTDIRGRVVRILYDGSGPLPAASGITWDGQERSGCRAPAGVYMVTVAAGHTVQHGILHLIR